MFCVFERPYSSVRELGGSALMARLAQGNGNAAVLGVYFGWLERRLGPAPVICPWLVRLAWEGRTGTLFQTQPSWHLWKWIWCFLGVGVYLGGRNFC